MPIKGNSPFFALLKNINIVAYIEFNYASFVPEG